MKEIDVKEAARRVRDEGARIIDVRESREWKDIRIPGAELMPLSDFEADPTMLPPAQNIIFQCAHGIRSVTAATLYEEAWAGIESASLIGGITAWDKAGFPTES